MAHIQVRACRQHNLQGISLDLPRDQWICLTGVSGSGKSSLVFDTLFAEGQRRYLESLAIRGHLLPRPDVDVIEGLPPTLAIGQGMARLRSDQTVGTVTETHDLLAILFARIGDQHSPTTGEKLERHTPEQIVEQLLREQRTGVRLQILAPLSIDDALSEVTIRLEKMGYVRVRIDGIEHDLSLADPLPKPREAFEVVVDRLILHENVRERFLDSLSLALKLGNGRVMVQTQTELFHFAAFYYCAATGEAFEPLQPADLRRFSAQARACRIEGVSLPELLALPIPELRQRLLSWTLLSTQEVIAAELLPRIHTRLDTLTELDLDYLTLDRQGSTLSIGETQRVQLAAQIGARLAGIAYILDEPSRGLHPQDVARLQHLLRRLQQQGNTLIVVEHDLGLIQSSDWVVELGPGAGRLGGQLIFQGTADELAQQNTPTGNWLSGRAQLHERLPARKASANLSVGPITCHNLNKLKLEIPLGVMVGFCGVSGSGKSTLVVDVLAEQLKEKPPDGIDRILVVDQRAAGISPRSMPATYIGLMTPLRRLLAETPLARARGYTAAHFSLTRKGGRCSTCEGLGQMRVRLNPLPDIWTSCETCHGKRYNFETLQVNWKGYSPADILEMSVSEALRLFEAQPQLANKLTLMDELGLGYLQLGQPFHTLSGGEAQRLKLVGELAKKATLYILDEPSAGLHAADIAKLLAILHRLVDQGSTVWIIEHRLEILRQADWLIELGPGAGPQGGQVIFTGPSTKLAGSSTPTGKVIG